MFTPGNLSLFVVCSLLESVPACSGPSLSCGPGTHQEGDVCVADHDADVPDVAHDAEADVALDTDVPVEADVEDADADGDACHPCTPGSRRCDSLRLLACLTLPDGCTTWTLEQTCTHFEECREPDVECVVPETEPAGSLVAEVERASWGIAPESMLWDGTTALVTFGDRWADRRAMAFLRFTESGLVRPLREATIDDQRSSLAEASGRTFVHWSDYSSHASVGEVNADDTVGTIIDADHNSMGGNLYAFGVGTGVLLHQTSTAGGSNAYLGFFDPYAWMITWYSDQPLFQWWTPSAAAVASTDGFAAAWLTADGSGLALGRFGPSGSPLGAPTVTALALPVALVTALVLLPDGTGYVLVWVGDDVLHLSRFDAAGSLVADDLADTGDVWLNALAWVGQDGEDLLISCRPDSQARALVLLRLDSAGTVLDETVLTSRGGVAKYAAGRLAVVWGIADIGIGYAVVPLP
jgi:hypothetical protein